MTAHAASVLHGGAERSAAPRGFLTRLPHRLKATARGGAALCPAVRMFNVCFFGSTCPLLPRRGQSPSYLVFRRSPVLSYVRIALVLTTCFVTCAIAAPPKVIITSPDNGEIDVDPAITEIRVEYDQPMSPDGKSILGGGPTFPQISGKITWANPKTLVIPVT